MPPSLHRAEVMAALAESPLFAGIDATLRERLAGFARLRRIDAGRHLWREGDPARHFVAIRIGVVEVCRTTPEGERIALGLFGPDDAVGLPAALENGRYPADAIALSHAAQVLLVDTGPVNQALAESAPLAAALNRALLAHTTALRAKIDIVSAGTVPRRLATLVLYLAERFGEPRGDATEIALNLTREQIGQVIGARVETVIRLMSRWQKAGWLNKTAEGFELRRADMVRRVIGPP